MKVYVLAEHLEDGRGGSDEVIRGVYKDEDWADQKGAAYLSEYSIYEWEIDENSFS